MDVKPSLGGEKQHGLMATILNLNLNLNFIYYFIYIYIYILLQNCLPPLLVKSTNRGGGKG